MPQTLEDYNDYSEEEFAELLREASQEVKRRKLERSLMAFTEFVFKEVYKKEFFKWPHTEIIISELEGLYKGKFTSLLINIPPRHGKTEIVCIIFIAWIMVRNPAAKNISTSYSQSRVEKSSSGIQQILESSVVQELWPIEFDKRHQSKAYWQTTAGGHFYGKTIYGGLTGEGCGQQNSKGGREGVLVIDDPHKASDIYSEAKRERVNSELNNTVFSRFNDPANTPIVIIMQRLHEMDMSGFVLDGRTERNFRHLVLRAIKEEGDDHPLDKRAVGDALCPAIRDEGLLLKQANSDLLTYAGQYQQRPAPLEGNLVKREWIRRYNRQNLSLDKAKIYLSADYDFGDKSAGKSKTCLSVYALIGRDIYLYEQIFKKMDFPDALNMTNELIKKYPRITAIIETKAAGPAILASLRRNKVRKIIPFKPQGTKIERFKSVTDYYASGVIYYPEGPAFEDHLTEILLFPNTDNDDRLDCETQLLMTLDKMQTRFLNI